MTMKLTQPLKWWGGKNYLAPKIIDLMYPHLSFVEPYCGGMAVLLNKDPLDPRHQWGEKSYEQGISEVVNDVYHPLQNFWDVLTVRGVVRGVPAHLGSDSVLGDMVNLREQCVAHWHSLIPPVMLGSCRWRVTLLKMLVYLLHHQFEGQRTKLFIRHELVRNVFVPLHP